MPGLLHSLSVPSRRFAFVVLFVHPFLSTSAIIYSNLPRVYHAVIALLPKAQSRHHLTNEACTTEGMLYVAMSYSTGQCFSPCLDKHLPFNINRRLHNITGFSIWKRRSLGLNHAASKRICGRCCFGPSALPEGDVASPLLLLEHREEGLRHLGRTGLSSCSTGLLADCESILWNVRMCQGCTSQWYRLFHAHNIWIQKKKYFAGLR